MMFCWSTALSCWILASIMTRIQFYLLELLAIYIRMVQTKKCKRAIKQKRFYCALMRLVQSNQHFGYYSYLALENLGAILMRIFNKACSVSSIFHQANHRQNTQNDHLKWSRFCLYLRRCQLADIYIKWFNLQLMPPKCAV